MRKIIIDTDTGGDDAAAILMACKYDGVEIVGVTVAAGNVDLEQASKNALMTLEIGGCNAPVYLGANSSLNGVEKECFSVYGLDGMGDQDLIHPTRSPETEDAVNALIRIVEANPYEIEIVSLAPVTNIARAIIKAPDVMKKVKRIWSMASSGIGSGNATPVAEFNVYKDAEAYDILLKANLPLTIIGLDMCDNNDTLISVEQLESMKKGNAIQSFCAKAFTGLLDFRRKSGMNNVDCCDGVAMAHTLFDDFTTSKLLCNASCITVDCEAYGQVIFYRSDFVYDSMPDLGKPNVELVNGQLGKTFFNRINELFTK